MLCDPTVLELVSQMLAATRGNYLWEDDAASENAARPSGVDSNLLRSLLDPCICFTVFAAVFI